MKQGSDSDAKGVEAVKAVNDVRKRRSDWIESNVVPPFLLKIHSSLNSSIKFLFFSHFLKPKHKKTQNKNTYGRRT